MTDLIRHAMNRVGKDNFNYIKENLKDGKYVHNDTDDLDEHAHSCVAFYRGKPVFGYLKHSCYANGKLVLHQMHSSEYNSFSGSEAENGHWILFERLERGEVCNGYIDEIKGYAETKYGWSDGSIKNKPMKKKSSPINWLVKFQSNDGQDNIAMTKGMITFGDVDYAPSEFKRDYDLRRAILAKYEKEFGKVS